MSLARRETLPFLMMRTKNTPSFVIETGKENELNRRMAFAETTIYGIVEEYTGEQR